MRSKGELVAKTPCTLEVSAAVVPGVVSNCRWHHFVCQQVHTDFQNSSPPKARNLSMWLVTAGLHHLARTSARTAFNSRTWYSRASMQKFSSKTIFEGWGASGRRLQCVDCHAGGEPARVVLGGLPAIPGRSMVEKRLRMMEPDFDAFRKLLLLEPRGYPCQNANFVIPPTGCHPTAAYGVIIAEQGHVYPAMSGHNLMCVATALLETGMVRMFEQKSTDFDLETPAGLVSVSADCKHGKVVQVTIRNVASFCRPEDMDIEIHVPELGKVTLDVAYGGMFYAIVDASTLGLQLLPKHGREICRLGEMIKTACREQHPVNHPEFDYPGCDILVFTENQRREASQTCPDPSWQGGLMSWSRGVVVRVFLESYM